MLIHHWRRFQNISDSKINNGAHAGDNSRNYFIHNNGHGPVINNTVNFHIQRMKSREGIHERKVRGYHQGWRGRGDITSFFFSNFPDNYHEEDMRRVFKKWGRVWEVFIARKKNKGGHRFGFVRFQGVQNVYELEKQLDEVSIEGKKVYVNLSRYNRQPMVDGNGRNGGKRKQQKNGGNVGLPQQNHVKQTTEKPSWKNKKYVAKTMTGPQRALKVCMEKKKWLNDCWVGRLRNISLSSKIQEKGVIVGSSKAKLTHMGGDMILIAGLKEEEVREMIESGDETMMSMFYSVEKWHSAIASGKRLVWLRCCGIPLHAGDRVCFANIVSTIGMLVDVDRSTENMETLEYARLLVRTSALVHIVQNISLRINEGVHHIRVFEEVSVPCQRCTCCTWNFSESSSGDNGDEVEERHMEGEGSGNLSQQQSVGASRQHRTDKDEEKENNNTCLSIIRSGPTRHMKAARRMKARRSVDTTFMLQFL